MPCCGGSNKTDKWSRFPDAAYNGNVEKMKELVKKEGGKDPKAYVDKADSEGMTALHRAAQNGQCDAIQYLVAYKADTKAITAQGETVLHIACFHRKYQAVEALLKTDAKAHINTQEKKHGMTPLHVAVNRGAPDIAELLLNNSADPSIEDKHGQTAETMAQFWAEQERAGMSSPQAKHQATYERFKVAQ